MVGKYTWDASRIGRWVDEAYQLGDSAVRQTPRKKSTLSPTPVFTPMCEKEEMLEVGLDRVTLVKAG